jgi:hypothetical protein
MVTLTIISFWLRTILNLASAPGFRAAITVSRLRPRRCLITKAGQFNALNRRALLILQHPAGVCIDQGTLQGPVLA